MVSHPHTDSGPSCPVAGEGGGSPEEVICIYHFFFKFTLALYTAFQEISKIFWLTHFATCLWISTYRCYHKCNIVVIAKHFNTSKFKILFILKRLEYKL